MPRLELHSYVFANYFLYLFNCFWHYIYRTHYVNSLEICHRLWKVSFGSELFIVSCELSLSLFLSHNRAFSFLAAFAQAQRKRSNELAAFARQCFSSFFPLHTESFCFLL